MHVCLITSGGLLFCGLLQGKLGKELAAFCSVPGHFLGLDLAPAADALQLMESASCCPLEVADGIEECIHLLVEAAAAMSDG